jgi:hypothetical protein
MSSQHFTDILQQMKTIHDKKSHDYAQDTDPFSNFTRAATIVSWFTSPTDQVFAGILGIKFARLAELLSTSKEPNNESIDDTFIDAANYFVLWAAYYRREKELKKLVEEGLKHDIRSIFGPKVEVRPQGEYKMPVDLPEVLDNHSDF